MEKFSVHTGVAAPLRRSNVDTDQIIPAVYLKRITKTGFEDGLFASWRGDKEFVLNQEPYKNWFFCSFYHSNYLLSLAFANKAWRYRPVWLWGFLATSSGVPSTTMDPPRAPPSGPTSMTQSAVLMTSKLCSIIECNMRLQRFSL